MMIRNLATFRADFPDDQIDDDNDIVQYGGKGVTEAIREMLVGLGYGVSEPIHAHEHGWELHIEAQERNLWCQVTDLREYMILIFDNPTMFCRRPPQEEPDRPAGPVPARRGASQGPALPRRAVVRRLGIRALATALARRIRSPRTADVRLPSRHSPLRPAASRRSLDPGRAGGAMRAFDQSLTRRPRAGPAVTA